MISFPEMFFRYSEILWPVIVSDSFQLPGTVFGTGIISPSTLQPEETHVGFFIQPVLLEAS